MLMTVHNFSTTVQHRTVLIISPLTSRQSSQLRCCLSEKRAVIAVYTQVAQLSQRNRAAAAVSFGLVVDDGVGQ